MSEYSKLPDSGRNNKAEEMKGFLTQLFLVTFLFVILLSSCTDKKSAPPYFGNGVHNGWADQNSITIWTRLTQNPDGNNEGNQFIDISLQEAKALDEEGNEDKINAAQIPKGLFLHDMKGACPGSEGWVRLTYYPLKNDSRLIKEKWIEVDVEKNYTMQWKISNLEPGTKYIMELSAKRNRFSPVSSRITGSFKTPPAENVPESIEFCVVTCHDYIRRDSSMGHKIYEAMMKLDPDFYVHTGDIEYYDKPLPWAMTEEMMYFKWDRLFALPLQREFWSGVTSYFMKDDHDVLRDDAYPGMIYGKVSWDRGLEIFQEEQFPSHDKFYKTIRWGKDLQIWITEGRNYRSKNDADDGPDKTIFGREQKEWLFRTLKDSDATYKVIINANPILGPDRANKKDNYSNSNFRYEGDEIRKFLNQFDNVFLCNGDRHWQYVTHFENTHLWEFSCGAGSDEHAGGWKQTDLRPEHKFLRVKGGFLRGFVSRETGSPTLTFQHIDVDGNVVHEERFLRLDP
jgi:alkaline phosphatase D